LSKIANNGQGEVFMKFLTLLLILAIMPCASVFAQEQTESNNKLTEHQQWLKNKFTGQHNELIPIVAVADMLFACNQANDNAYGKHSLKALITQLPKQRLAEKLSSCLAGESVNSETAINYGLLGCFHDQLDGLPEVEKRKKVKLVKSAIASLSFEERKQSFTQCVTDQSIAYLK